MAVFRTVIRSDLQKPLVVQQLSGNMFTADNASNEIAVEVTNGGEPVALSGAVTAYAVRADGVTAMFSGTISGNVASVILPASCYTQVGTLSIVVKVGATTVGACTCYVYRTTTDEIVDPGHVIPSIDELLEQIEACRTATTNANTATANANTAASNANSAATNANTKAGVADTAAQNANAKATAADTAATNANTAAGKIDNMTVAATGLPAGVAPVATITEVDGHKHIAFQIPKGDKGKDFHIAKTFASIAAMMAYTGTDLEKYDFAMIDTGSVEDPDTGKLYCYEPEKNPKWSYIGDLSGAQGIKGETGTGIDHVTLNADYTLTIYYDDGTSDTTPSIRGATGITPAISIGSVTTLTPNQHAFVELDQTSTPESPVFNFGIPKGDTGTVENVYGSTLPMSPQDSTKVEAAINNKASKVSNATNGNLAGLDANGNLTDSGKSAEDFAGAIYKTATPGSIITIEDGADDLPVKELKVAIEPVQDLHGYDHPWPAGGGKNKFPITLESQSKNGTTFTVANDGTITISNTPSELTRVGLNNLSITPNEAMRFSSTGIVTGLRLFCLKNDSGVTSYPTISPEAILASGKTYSAFILEVSTSFTGTATIKMQLETGSTATEWTPYSNICPITGWTGAKVTRTGKNLLDSGNVTSGKGLTITKELDGSINVSGTPTGTWIDLGYHDVDIPAGEYVFSVQSVLPCNLVLYFYYKNDTQRQTLVIANGYTYRILNNEKNIGRISLGLTGLDTSTNYNFTFQPKLELGTTATAYEPYQGKTYDITFPSEAGTVFGGNLTIHADGTGELVVDKRYVEFNGTENWVTSSVNSVKIDISNVKNIYNGGKQMFSHYKTKAGTAPDNTAAISNALYVHDNRHTSGELESVAANFKAYLAEQYAAGTPLSVACDMVTPITYTITAQQVRTLLGINNIWADTGDITKLIYPVNTDTAMALYEKADKVANATVGNFAALDANGNLTDSGKKPSDILSRANVVDLIYPVGSIYMSVASTSPATLFDGTTWEQLKDKFLLGAGDTYTAGDTGGNASHTLTIAEMPSHNHTFTGSAVDTGNQSVGHTHTYTDYYATTTGGTAISVAQLASHHHANVASRIGTPDWKYGPNEPSQSYRVDGLTGNEGSNNSHTHSGANTSTTRTSDGISANHTHSVTASGTIGNSGDGTAFSILPPYLAVYMWKRVA